MFLSQLGKQRAQFNLFSVNAKRVLKANCIFGFVLPFYIIFSNTYIFNYNPVGDISFNIIYSALTFVGNPLGFILSGLLLKKFHVKYLFIVGMNIIIANMAVMMFIPSDWLVPISLFLFGLVSGLGSGIYWSSRTYLTVVSTSDNVRDFFSGLDYVFFIAGGIVTPALVGTWIGLHETGIFTRQFAYQCAMLVALFLVVLASIIVAQGSFPTVRAKNFLKYSYQISWRKTRAYVFIMGIYHGAILAVPAVFMMLYVGKEQQLGIIESATHFFALISIYTVSSISRAALRPYVMLGGSLLFLTGAIMFGSLLPSHAAIATIILVIAFYLSDPTMNFPYRATFMRAIDDLSTQEKRDPYTYLTDIEQFNALGRLVSIVVFYLLYRTLPATHAFAIYVVGVALFQFINVGLCRRINSVARSQIAEASLSESSTR